MEIQGSTTRSGTSEIPCSCAKGARQRLKCPVIRTSDPGTEMKLTECLIMDGMSSGRILGMHHSSVLKLRCICMRLVRIGNVSIPRFILRIYWSSAL